MSHPTLQTAKSGLGPRFVTSEPLRIQLRQLGIRSLYHEDGCLRAMIERRMGVRLSAVCTPDHQAQILIELEDAASRPSSLIKQYSSVAQSRPS